MNTTLLSILLVLSAVLSRIVCAEVAAFNFAPIVAIGLISGMLVKNVKHAFLIALLGQFVADIYFEIFKTAGNVGFYGTAQLFVYAGLIFATMSGRIFNRVNVQNVFGGTLIASFLFFVVSNLGVYLSGYYGYTWQGFVQNYVNAIPFFKNSLIADMAASALFFGLYFTFKPLLKNKLATA